jgi:hypothetical protein
VACHIICNFFTAPAVILPVRINHILRINQTFTDDTPFRLPTFQPRKSRSFSHSEKTRSLPAYYQRYLNVSERLEMSLAKAFPATTLVHLNQIQQNGT